MNWLQRIQRAEKRGSFTDKDKKLASDAGWCHCFVGELLQIKHLRNHDGEDSLIPQRTINLGVAFGEAVRWNELDKVKAIYEKLQTHDSVNKLG